MVRKKCIRYSYCSAPTDRKLGMFSRTTDVARVPEMDSHTVTTKLRLACVARFCLVLAELKGWQGKPAQSMSHAGISLSFKSLRSGKITFGEKLRRIICWTCLSLSQAAAWTWGTRKFSYPWITAPVMSCRWQVVTPPEVLLVTLPRSWKLVP